MGGDLINRKSEDQRLWQRVREKKPDAYEKFYFKFAKDLINYGIQLSNNEQLTEDAVHDLFMEIFTMGKRLSVNAEPRAYLFRALRNNIFKLMSAEKRLNADITHADLRFFTETNITEKLGDEHLQLLKMLNKLSPREKEIIYLRFFEEMNNNEICKVMSLKKQTVKNIVCSAMKKLRCFITDSEKQK